jgi:hypothetical protein
VISVPAFVTVPARVANIEMEPIQGGAYAPSIRALTGIRGLGDDSDDPSVLTDVLQAVTAGATSAATLINATNPCPAGQVRNAAGICAFASVAPGVPGAVVGSVATPVGTATVGVSGTVIAMMALAGLVVLVLLMKK